MTAKHTRESIGARLRYDVLRRCNFACYYCGMPASMGVKQLHIDHVIPVALGGTNDPWNLVAACWDCNAGKTNGAPSQELVRQVREDYSYYTSPLDAVVDMCAYCGFPDLVDVEAGEEPQGQCATCNRYMCEANESGFRTGWEYGYQRALDDLLQKGGGPDVVQG